MAERTRRIEAGDQTVVGVNAFTETEPSPLDSPGNILTVDPAVEHELIAEVDEWRPVRDQAAVDAALAALHDAAVGGGNIMEPSIALAKAGGTTGEWAGCLREVFGEFRAPTGVNAAVGRRVGELAAVAEFVKTHGRRAAAVPRGQARPRRPQQRRRADRRRGPRRRHGGRVQRHPPRRPSRSWRRHATRTPT